MKKRFRVLSIILIAFTFFSCSNLVGNDGSDELIADNIGVKSSYLIQGTVSQEAYIGSASRTAFPAQPGGVITYKIKAECNGEIVTTEITNASTDFTLKIPHGGIWYVSAEGFSDSNPAKLILKSEEKLLRISEESPMGYANLVLKPYVSESGTGKINLSITIPTTVSTVAVKCISDNKDSFTGVGINVSRPTVTIGENSNNIKSGSYTVEISFKGTVSGVANVLLYHVTEVINVYDNLTTNAWVKHGDEPYIKDDGTFEITDAMTQDFMFSTVYVGGEGANDENTGTFLFPVATLTKAFTIPNAKNFFITGEVTASKNFNASVSGFIKKNPSSPAGTEAKITVKNIEDTSKSFITVYLGVSLDISDVEIVGSNASISQSGACINNSGTVSLRNCKIHGFNASQMGGGIYNAGIMEITGVQIYDCTAEEGGGIYNEKKLTVTGGKINGCRAKNGSAIYTKGIPGSSEDNVNLTGELEITGNTTWEGTIRAESQAKIKIDGIKIHHNNAYNRGGALYIAGGSRFTMESGEICYNNAKKENWTGVAEKGGGDGGAIFLWGASGYTGSIIMNGGSIYDNSAEGKGGCIYIQDGSGKASSFTMTAGSVYGNIAAEGKAIYNTEGGKINLSGSAYIAADNEIYLGSSNDFYVTVAGALTPPADAAGTVAHILKENASAGNTVLGGTTALLQSEYGKFKYDGIFEIESTGKLVAVVYVYGQAETSGEGTITSPKKQLSAAYSSAKVYGSAKIYVAGTTSEGAATDIATGDTLTDITVKQWPQDKWESSGHTGTVPPAVIGNGTMVASDSLIKIASGKTVRFEDITFDGNSVQKTISPGSSPGGGCIYNSGDLTLDNVIIKNFSLKQYMAWGGGIYNQGTLTVEDAVISGCKVINVSTGGQPQGGGIYNKGTATIKKGIITGCEGESVAGSLGCGAAIATSGSGSSFTLGDKNLEDGVPDVIIGIGTYKGTEYTTQNTGTVMKGGGVYAESSSITLNKDCVIGKYNPESAATDETCGNSVTSGLGAGLYCDTAVVTIDGAHIAYNYVIGSINGGIIRFEKNRSTSINNLDVSYNRTNNTSSYDKGLMIYTYGYKFENLNVHDNVWNEAYTPKGHGMYVYGDETVEFAGSTCFSDDADIYLDGNGKITINSDLTADKVAAITVPVDAAGKITRTDYQILAPKTAGSNEVKNNYQKFTVDLTNYSLMEDGKLAIIITINPVLSLAYQIADQFNNNCTTVIAKIPATVDLSETISVPQNKTLYLMPSGTSATIKNTSYTSRMFTLSRGSKLIVTDVTLNGNDVPVTGAGSIIYISDGTLTLNGSTKVINGLSKPDIYSTGGAIYSTTDGSINITDNVEISGNKTENNSFRDTIVGGGICSCGPLDISGNAKITNNSVSNNSNSTMKGGGIYSKGIVTISGNVEISGNTLESTGDRPSTYGAGIYIDTGNSLVIDGEDIKIINNKIIANNAGNSYGTGICTHGNALSVRLTGNITITGNETQASIPKGLGIYVNTISSYSSPILKEEGSEGVRIYGNKNVNNEAPADKQVETY